MKKAYFLAPAILLGIFIFIYMGSVKKYEAIEAAKVQAAKDELRAEQLQEAANREQAIKEALAQNAERKAAREAKEAADLAKKEARQNATEALELARSERNRLSDKVKSLEKEVTEVEAVIAKSKLEKQRLADEAEFLRGFVTIAQNNEKEFQAVLQDIQKAEAAHAAALVAAAAAEKK